MADEASGVQRRRRPVERGKIIGEALIMVIVRVADQIERRRRCRREYQRREADAAIPGHDGGDTLARFGRHVRGRKQRAVVMGVHVNKARRHDLAREVDLARPRCTGDRPYSSNPVAGDGDVGAAARPAATVDHLAAPQNPIGHI